MLVQRIVYNVLDYLGDIGGLFGTFNGLANTFSLIMNFNGVYHLLTSSLFSVETKIVNPNGPNVQNGGSPDSPERRKRGVTLMASALGGVLNKMSSKAANISEF